MPDTVQLAPQPAAVAQTSTQAAAPAGGESFGQTLAAQARNGTAGGHRHHGGHHHHAATLVHLQAQHGHAPARHWIENPASVIPGTVQQALRRAMDLERVPASWHDGLQFIVAQESGGRVDTRSRVDTARGLFQLTHASYHMNPNGQASFGNAVEEAQGGIRYIRERYGTAENAASFWRSRFWY